MFSFTNLSIQSKNVWNNPPNSQAAGEMKQTKRSQNTLSLTSTRSPKQTLDCSLLTSCLNIWTRSDGIGCVHGGDGPKAIIASTRQDFIQEKGWGFFPKIKSLQHLFKTYSQAVFHSSINQARPCLASEIRRVHGGVAVSHQRRHQPGLYTGERMRIFPKRKKLAAPGIPRWSPIQVNQVPVPVPVLTK